MMHIFPEACNTNKTAVIKFKKGSFASLRAVSPLVFRYKEFSGIAMSQDVVGVLWAGFLGAASVFITVQVDYLPVFKPNDYFWEHHW